MTRRKLVALVAAVVLLALGLVVVLAGLFVTRTESGRKMTRDLVVPYLAGKWPNAKLYVGKVSGTLIGDLIIDTIAVRDAHNDELFLSTGRLHVTYNWRDLIDYRVKITSMDVAHPYVHVVQHKSGVWNFKEIFASKTTAPEPPKPTVTRTRGLGDYIVFDSVRAQGVTFLVTMSWTPDDTLKGAKRDSVIRAHLENPAKAVTKTFDGYGRTWAWRNGRGLITHARLADPDSDKFGREFQIATLSVDEYEPTFKFRNLQGVVKHLGDTVDFKIPHFELPASVANGHGRVWWGGNRPVRYGIDIHSDSLALDDVNWVYPTLPRTGGGSLDLGIKNDPANEKIVDFRIQRMNVRSMSSHLTGDMWFGIGAPVLLVRHVDLVADPVNFDLLRTLAGKPFPYDWRGDLRGTVKARGGPLTNFYIDDARATFTDAHVRGAVSRFSGKGELDILVPAYTAFHGFDVNAQAFDLRTIEFLNPAIPKMGGIVSGTATLDSSWLDVRFSNAHIAHQNGPGEPSRFSGSGRVTNETKYLVFDLTLNAEPLNATMLARSPVLEGFPLRGLFSGPMRIKGAPPDLEVSTTLQGAAAAFSFDGRVDADSIGGRGAHGRGQFSNVDLNALLEKTTFPEGKLSGHYDVAVDSIGVTPSSVRGTFAVDLDPTLFDSVRVRPSLARLRFADGRIIVDSLNVRTDAFTLTTDGRGAIGLPGGRPDSLRFAIYVDSLGGLRPLLPPPVALGGVAKPDSLSGLVKVVGVARGTLDSLAVAGIAYGSHLYWEKDRGDSVYGSFDFQHLLTPARRVGTADLRVFGVAIAGIAWDTIGGQIRYADSTHRPFTVVGSSKNGLAAKGGGVWIDSAAVQTIVVDSAALTVGTSPWRLVSPARVTIDSTATRVDSLLVRIQDSGFVSFVANAPATGPAFARLRAASVPLRDVGVLAQLTDTISGLASLDVTATGTKAHPVIGASGMLSSVKWAGLDADRVEATGRYANFRGTAEGDIVIKGQRALTASANWPLDITLFGVKQRKDSIHVQLLADNTDLSLITPLFKHTLDSLKGQIHGRVDITGDPAAKVYAGDISIRNGKAKVPAAGVTFDSITADIHGERSASDQDSIKVNVSIGTGVRNHASLTGFVKNLAGATGQRRLDLRLQVDSLHVFNRRSVANVWVSTPDTLRLAGPFGAATLTGGINVDKGAMFLADADLARKLNVGMLADTTTAVSNSSTLFTTLMTNLQIPSVPVTLGQDVKLQSSEADVGLTGALRLLKSSVPARVIASTGQLVPGLALEGTLYTTGGTYNLNLVLVQREFSVLTGGTVTFDAASSPETPYVDIKAQYNVNEFSDRQLGVIVAVKGRMPNPRLEFSSNAQYTIETSDLLSYLIIGRPGFDFAGNQGTSQLVASVLSPTISAVTANSLRPLLGSWVDAFQLEFGTYNVGTPGENIFSGKNIQAYLYSATISAGRAYKNFYLSVNTGLCGYRDRGLSGGLADLGGSAEYRFTPDFSFQAAYEPSSLTRQSCLSSDQSLVGLVPAPPQLAFSLKNRWRW